MWARRVTDHRELVAYEKSLGSSSAAKVPVEYQLVVAAYKVNGNETRIGFSDGTDAIWNPRSNMYTRDFHLRPLGPSSPYLLAHERLESPRLLERLVEILYEHDVPVSLQTIVPRLADGVITNEFMGALHRALEAGVKWALLSPIDESDRLELTSAGMTWHEASDMFQARRALRRPGGTRERAGQVTMNFSIGDNFSGIFNYAGRDIAGNSSVENRFLGRELSNDQALECLKELLASSQIPWERKELRGIRKALVAGVDQGDIDSHEVTSAFFKLREIVTQLTLGVAGNGIYQLLLDYFSHR
jgi:hypothetical protein